MSEVKNIKGIDDETWAHFKSLAAQHKMKAANMFRILLEEYEKNTKNFWDDIFAHKSIFTDKEYEEMKARMKELRKEYGWRT